MIAHERVNRRAMAALVVLLLSLPLCALLAFRYWWRAGGDEASGVQPPSAQADGSVAGDPARAIDQIVGEINAARARAQNARDGAGGYEQEGCGPVNRLEAQGRQLTASERIAAAANQCANYTQKFNAYHSSLEELLVKAGKVGTIGAQVEALRAQKPSGNVTPTPEPAAGGPSWLALLLAAAVSVAASVAASAALFVFFAGRELRGGQQQSAAVLANGFSTVNESLRQVHAALSEWARAALASDDAEGRAGRAGKSGRAGAAERAAQPLHPLAADVRQGFKELQGVLRNISDKLSALTTRPAPPPAASDGREPAASPSSAPAPSPLPPAPPSSPSLSPSALSSPTAREPHPPTPEAMLVEGYKQRFEATAGVSAAYKAGYLETDADGKLLVLRDERANLHYLIPKEERLQTPSFFNQDYATYYDGDVDLKPGLILILKPATVSPAGAFWRLETKGRLTTGKPS